MGAIEVARKRSHRRANGSAKTKLKRRIFIATEGVTEYQYFNMLKKQLRAENIDVLKSTRKTDPQSVRTRLEKYRPKHGDIRDDDERWLVIDKDDYDLSSIFSAADRRKYLFADSNPCFELWLILHCKALHQVPGLEGSAMEGGCEKVIEALRKHVESNYHKTKYNVAAYVERRDVAKDNAEKTDSNKNSAWMNAIGTRVYQLVDSIRKSARNTHNPLN